MGHSNTIVGNVHCNGFVFGSDDNRGYKVKEQIKIDENKLYSVKESAHYLGISYSSMLRMIHSEKVDHIHLGGKKVKGSELLKIKPQHLIN